jgi:hypothetical protein
MVLVQDVEMLGDFNTFLGLAALVLLLLHLQQNHQQ